MWKTWQWCKDAYARNGYTLSFPKNTDPHKTYQWRYVTSLTNRLNDWELNDDTSKLFISTAVEYLKQKKLLHKGLSIFMQNNMLELCYDYIKKSGDSNQRRISLLYSSKNFLDSKSNKRDLKSVLISRPCLDMYYNIVEWYMTDKISKMYLALSKSCTSAIHYVAKVNSEQRKLLPTASELFCIGCDVADNKELLIKAKAILYDDWRAICYR